MHQVDLLNDKSVDELAEKLSGKVDVLVINAGMADSGSVLEGVHILLSVNTWLWATWVGLLGMRMYWPKISCLVLET